MMWSAGMNISRALDSETITIYMHHVYRPNGCQLATQPLWDVALSPHLRLWTHKP
jgi:hypothetical protein